MNIIDTVTQWNKDARNTTEGYNVRQTALYTGLQCEELAEKLEACGLFGIAAELEALATELKQGAWDSSVRDGNRLKMLDADCDLMVVTIGSAISQGADFKGAMEEVIASNESKRFQDGKLYKDQNGKVLKPKHFKEPLLEKHLTRLK